MDLAPTDAAAGGPAGGAALPRRRDHARAAGSRGTRPPRATTPDFWRAVARLGWLGFGAAGGVRRPGRLAPRPRAPGRGVRPRGGAASASSPRSPAGSRSPPSARRRRSATWLPRVARGERLVTLARRRGATRARDPTAFATHAPPPRQAARASTARSATSSRASPPTRSWSRRATAAACRSVLVPARHAGRERARPSATFGKDRQSVVRFRDVTLPASALAGRPGAAWPRLEQLRAARSRRSSAPT